MGIEAPKFRNIIDTTYFNYNRKDQRESIDELNRYLPNIDGIIRDEYGQRTKSYGRKNKDAYNLEFVTFSPNQVKSADYNTGEFSPFNDEIANYDIDNSNINYILSEDEKKDILKEISKINETKRSLIDIGNDFLYIVDHTDKDGLEHLKDNQEGFLCKEIIDIKGFSKEEINQLKKEYDLDKGSQEATRGLNNWLERNGYSKRYFNWDNSSIEDRGGNKKNDRVDSQEQRQTSIRGRGSEHLQEDFPLHEVKTGYDGTNHPRYMDAKDFLDSMNDKDLIDELHLIKQESADYDLLFAIEPEHKKSGKAIPQDFTFADGTTIKAPFKPNEQQEEALNAMDRFIKSDDTTMTLSGYAGTGKTSLMEMIAKKARKQGGEIMFCASTNKAAAVLNDKVSKSGFKATTLNKLFGISVEVDSHQKSYNARNLVNVLKSVDIIPGTTVIIDEASMINEENYKTLNQIAESNGLKLIYVGDEAQLAPVNENQISKVFRNGDGKVITLTQVERTDDNAILKEATNIRNGKPLSGESSFNSKGEGVAFVSPQHQETVNEVIAHYVQGLKKDPNYFRILAYTNKAVTAYNNQVRTLLGYDSLIPHRGEPMTGYANWGYDWKTKSNRFINSESYKVISVDTPVQKSITLDNGNKVTIEATPITLEDSMGNRDTFDFMDIKGNSQNRTSAMILANEKKRLWNKARVTPGKAAKIALYQKINAIESFLFVNDNIEDNDHNLLQGKVIDFGYAMTVHKSQGSTFTHVLMDDVDISKSIRSNNPIEVIESVDLNDNGQVPTEKDVMNSSEDVDLGDLTGAIVEKSNTSVPINSQNNTANIKQQLEYVGVSRATDTVTIISNNTEKEGSPLHPEDNLKDNTINAATQRSNTTEPHQGFISDGARQLVNHLKSMGINVFGRAEMEKFFKEHPNMLVQMARTFGKENPYLNSKYRKQKSEILSIIKTNKYSKPGTDAITLDSDNHKVIYLIDHSADKELADNLKKGDGFGIRKTYNIETITKEDVREIIRNISPSYEYSTERVLHALQTTGLTKEHLLGIDLNDEFKRAANSTDVLYGKNRGVWSQGGFGYDNSNSKQGRRIEGNLGQKTSSQVTEDGTEFFLTPQGEVYGFVDKDGNIYLDETKISPEHPLHEYTHLWDRAVAQKNPQLWNRGVELMKQTSLWNEVLNDENYGKKWQSTKNIPQEKLDSLIASEVHSRLVGKNGAEILSKLAKEKGKEGIIGKLKQWILDFWKDLKATFSSWTKDDLDKLTLKDFNNMTLRDFTEGINPIKTKESNINNN